MFHIVQTSTGYVRFQRPSMETAEAKVADMLREDAEWAKSRALSAANRTQVVASSRDESPSDGATEGNDSWSTARVTRERFDD